MPLKQVTPVPQIKGSGNPKIKIDVHKMSYPTRIIWFMFLNFGMLALGSLFTNEALQNDEWYKGLNRAPWEPPGWVFGLAWSLIMVFFSIFLADLFSEKNARNMTFLMLSLLLNVLWSPLFFEFHYVLLALIVIISLETVITVKFVMDLSKKKMRALLLLPYVIWLIIAISLNFWVLLKNP